MAAEEQLREYLKKATVELREARLRLRELEEGRADPVAIVGMGCRLPGGVTSPEALWDLVTMGRDAISPPPEDRGWDPGLLAGATAMGGFLYDGADFDPAPFRIGRDEALAMDPQHRLLLETAWEAVERARIDPAALAGTRTGVYVGMTQGSYARGLETSAPEEIADHLAAGNVANTAAGRLAHVLDLSGPALTLDTACSSSLVALHVAVRALRAGECDLALVGGAAFMARPDAFADFARREGLAPDGRCKAFGAAADGMGFAEGAGVLVLETAESARRHGRPILALVAGTAVGHDGATNGLGAPSAPAQRRVIAAALADAGLRPDQVDAVEAHGTGTSIGDAAEATALLEEYGAGRERPLYVGTVKSNIGHTQAAGGIAAVVKTVQALRHGWLPRTLHAEPPTPHADWTSGSVSLLTHPVPWPRTGAPRRAGVSSFGASGTNAHVVLCEAPAAAIEGGGDAATPGGTGSAGWTVWPLAARSEAALRDRAAQLLRLLDQHPDMSPVDLGRSLATTRTAFPVRTAIVAASPADFRAGLERMSAGTVNRPSKEPPAGLLALAERYVRGETIAWDETFAGAGLVDLPTYPFQRERFWLTPSPAAAQPGKTTKTTPEVEPGDRAAAAELARRDPSAATGAVRTELLHLVGELLELGAEQTLPDDADLRLSEIGLDSVRALRMRRRIAARWGADVPLEQILGRATVTGLAGAVVAQLADRDGVPAADEPTALVPRPEQRFEPFPLTDVQHAYWIGRSTSVELGGIATNFYIEFDRDEPDVARLEQAWQRVVERHDMLRAVVGPDGRQRVLPEVPPYRIAVREPASGADAEADLEAVRTEMTRQLLPADRWPLFDVRVSMLDPDAGTDADADTVTRRSRIHVCVDMLILDGASLMLVLDEWRRFYQEPGWRPEPLSLSFRDVVLAEVEQAAGERTRKAEEYWTGRLDALPPAPALPLATAPAQLARPEFRRREAVLEPRTWAALTAAARRHGRTPSAVLMTAFSDVLRRWSGQDALTLNLTLFNRPPLHPQVEAVAGDFTSLTMLAVEPEPGAGFDRRAERLHGQLLRDLDHSAFSGVKVLRERARRLGGRPAALMPVVFTSLLGVGGGTEEHAGFFGEVVHAASQTPQVWLDHVVSEDRGRLVLNWYSAEALFPAGMLDDMFQAYVGALGRLAVDDAAWTEPDYPAALPAWQADERAAANATTADIPARTLYELVRDRAAADPTAVAVIAADGQLSYGELLDRAHRLGRVLQDLGAVPGELVGVLLDKSCEQVAAVLGVAASGAAYLPIDPAWPQARRAELLAHCRTGLVVTGDRWLDQGAGLPEGIKALTLTQPEVAAADPEPPEHPPVPADLAYVIFTSGSTGRPKGVMIDHRGAANTVQDINQRFEVTPEDRVLALSSLGFDLSVYDVFGVLAAGGAVVMPHPGREHDPAHWADLITAHRVTLWNSVPALLQAFVDSDPEPAPLRLALLSGDWIPVTLPDAFRALCPEARVISLGGATEASIWSIAHPIGEVPPEWTRIPYGKPLANQTMHVLGPELGDCPVWTVGEIHIGGIGVALGYWADPRQTAERFITRPHTGERLYKTGDLGRYLPGGDIDLLGRNDFQVKLNGYRIELDEIAAALRRQPGVTEALVTLAANDRTGRRALAAYVVAERGAAPDPAALRAGLADLLPEYMVPHHYLTIDRFPLSANGKVDRGRLPSPWDGQAGAERTAPRDDVEAVLFGIWQEALGHGDFGVEDNFFELGGDSLHGVRILGEVRTELGVDPGGDGGLELLFDHPTVAELAEAIRGLR